MTKMLRGKLGKPKTLPSAFRLGPAKPDPNGNRRERRAAQALYDKPQKKWIERK